MTDAKMQEVIQDAQITSDMLAFMATTDGSVPTQIKRLIGLTGGDQAHTTAWEITAIEPGTQRRWVPDGPLPKGVDRRQWSMARVCGEKINPPAIEQITEGYYARVMGCAVSLESWLQSQGYHSADAGSPNAVWIGPLCPGNMRLMPGDYHQCEQCDYVTED